MRRTPTLLPALLTASLLALAAGCGPQDELVLPPDPPEGAERAIVNGKTYNGHPSVGRLIKMSGGYAGSCTGTLIGKKMVLTAGHCVYPGGTHRFYLASGTYQTNDVVRHPQYGSHNGQATNDIAIVKLQQAPTETPSVVAQKPPFKGQKLTLIGYGITETGLKDSGVKRIGYNNVSTITSTRFYYNGATGSLSNVCSGDSGGPAFTIVDGYEVHQGIHSMASRPCGSRGINARTDIYYAWIKQQTGGDLHEHKPDTKPPTVSITEPAASAAVRQDFTVKVAAKDDVRIASIELFVDGASVEKKVGENVSFWITGAKVGHRTLKAVAIDGVGNKAEASVQVNVVPPKDYGAQCTEHLDCKSTLCASDPYRGLRFCTQACSVKNNNCPKEAACLPVHGVTMHLCGLPSTGVTDPEQPADDCTMGGAASSGPAALALLALLALRRRRR